MRHFLEIFDQGIKRGRKSGFVNVFGSEDSDHHCLLLLWVMFGHYKIKWMSYVLISDFYTSIENHAF